MNSGRVSEVIDPQGRLLPQRLAELRLTMRRTFARLLSERWRDMDSNWGRSIDYERLLADSGDDVRTAARHLQKLDVLCQQAAPRRIGHWLRFQIVEWPLWMASRRREERLWRARGWLA